MGRVRTWRKQPPRVTGAWATGRGNASRTNLLERESLWGSKSTLDDNVKVLVYGLPVIRGSGREGVGKGGGREKIFEKMEKKYAHEEVLECRRKSPPWRTLAHGSLYC
jgi:hypothetical protein